MRDQGGGLTRPLLCECVIIERVVPMVIDPFHWHEVECFAIALKEIGFRMLPVQPPDDEHDRPYLSYDFELMRLRTQNISNYEMEVLEEIDLARDHNTPTLGASANARVVVVDSSSRRDQNAPRRLFARSRLANILPIATQPTYTGLEHTAKSVADGLLVSTICFSYSVLSLRLLGWPANWPCL